MFNPFGQWPSTTSVFSTVEQVIVHTYVAVHMVKTLFFPPKRKRRRKR